MTKKARLEFRILGVFAVLNYIAGDIGLQSLHLTPAHTS